MSTFISLAKTAMLASYVPRNAFSAWHDPSCDVIGQMLGGSGSWNFQGGGGTYRRWGERYRKNGDIRSVNKKDVPEKPQGVGCITPSCAGLRWGHKRSKKVKFWNSKFWIKNTCFWFSFVPGFQWYIWFWYMTSITAQKYDIIFWRHTIPQLLLGGQILTHLFEILDVGWR